MADLSALCTDALSQGLFSGLHEFGHGDFMVQPWKWSCKGGEVHLLSFSEAPSCWAGAMNIQEMLGLDKVKAAPEPSVFALWERRGLVGDPDLLGTCSL